MNIIDTESHDELELLSSKKLAQLLGVSVSWLKKNRQSDKPIPYKKFGRNTRYQRDEVVKWLKKQSR